MSKTETEEKLDSYVAVVPMAIALTAPNLASARARAMEMCKGLSVLPSLHLERIRTVIYKDGVQVFPAVRVAPEEEHHDEYRSRHEGSAEEEHHDEYQETVLQEGRRES